ncbi:polysaccharide pyruvyl transferase family protein [Sphingobacterium paludis]|uniref:Polysaccharide pyruvyl transferase n=1 Tax=Sphingobacterium paludis TaxID=1476465 RepID=A0A4R7D2Q2_9SPHI|nr:polysaccharide pyruvyl transferase family protein [Sphingobacterium paludis]TDS13885.1 polysaccharide pyruvyl transferase [Sphingobacterium paludis]
MIGILTFSRCYNYGAFLQAYALHRFLLEQGYDNELIDYRSQKSIDNELNALWAEGKGNIGLKIRIGLKILKFRLYHSKFKKTKHYFNREELAQKHYDLAIVGSDQIWCYTKEWGGVDTPYFSDQLSADSIISYAASMGPDKYDQQHPRSIVRLMKNFHALGVRDTNSYKFAQQLNPTTPTLVLDPTLIYSFEKEVKPVNRKKYILFYSDGLLPDEKTLITLKKVAKKKGLQIVSIGKHFEWADVNVVCPSPFRWMGYIKNADFVFTCMYHGLLFSIKFNRQFAMFLIPERENKCLDFLKRCGLANRVVKEADQLFALVDTKIDYLPVNSFLQEQQALSTTFLIQNVADITVVEHAEG